MSTGMSCHRCVATLVAAGFSFFFGYAASAQDHFLARQGQAEAVIVAAPGRETFDRRVAGELQRYLQALSGAEFTVVASDAVPAEKPLIVLGGPENSPLAASAQENRLVSFAGLKPQGFVLKTIELDGRPAVVAGGNDEAGTMYAAYELLERLGIVFQLTNDIIPEQKPDLAMPSLDVRMEPVLKDRGMHCCHGIRWYMGLEDFRREIDQLAKLKMNVLQFYWGMGGPWAEFSYEGKVAEIIYPKESGYCAWAWNSGTAASVKVGRECFPPKVFPGSRDELDYVIYKTENFVTVFEELSAANEAKAAYDRAVLAMDDGKPDEVRKHLAHCQTALDRANRLVREAAEQMIPFAHIPTERHILYLFNDAMPSHAIARAYLAEVIAFCEGRSR